MKYKKFFWLLTVICAVVIFCMSSVASSGLPGNLGKFSYVAHFCEYFGLAALLVLSIYEPSHRFLHKLWVVVAVAIVIASLYGVSDEIHQMFVPGRTPDVFDWMTDTAGATFGAVVTTCVIKRLPNKAFLCGKNGNDQGVE